MMKTLILTLLTLTLVMLGPSIAMDKADGMHEKTDGMKMKSDDMHEKGDGMKMKSDDMHEKGDGMKMKSDEKMK
jgi:outer membrane lipoprotein-sorting protein